MVREKTISRPTTRKVRYPESHWALLREKREIAKPLMRRLANYSPYVHGSIARGDVHGGSDVDVVLIQATPSYAVEIALGNLPVLRREIVQATPWHLIKAHIYLEDDVSVTFPLVKPTPLEEQFYAFGGALDLEKIERNLRIPGIDKRLMLIDPVADGHVETSIIGQEAAAARKIGVGLDIVRERIEVLSRRDSVGRTGVYLKRMLSTGESFEDVLRHLGAADPNVKRRIST